MHSGLDRFDSTILHQSDAVRKGIHSRIVSDNNHRSIWLHSNPRDEFHCDATIFCIQSARWLVANKQAWLVHNSSRNGHPLLLPT